MYIPPCKRLVRFYTIESPRCKNRKSFVKDHVQLSASWTLQKADESSLCITSCELWGLCEQPAEGMIRQAWIAVFQKGAGKALQALFFTAGWMSCCLEQWDENKSHLSWQAEEALIRTWPQGVSWLGSEPKAVIENIFFPFYFIFLGGGKKKKLQWLLKK